MSCESLRILIADDNDSDRMILQAIVKRQGHQVVAARDGVEAIEKFKECTPQIVLMDALMPRMDGFEAAEVIKKLAGEELVPIIFLTSLTDAESLARCVDAGGDDFLSKPYNQIILQAKISAFNRMRIMHSTLQEQRDQIAENNEHLLQEQQVAKTVFDNVAHMGCLHARNIKHLLSPLSVFNGDVLLACQKPSGGMHVLLGDFTGHGLPAAIGAMPLAEIFYGMTNKGFNMTDVLREINQKLKNILPVGFFCCSCMIDLDFENQDIDIWIGGLPDAILYRTNGDVVKIKSNHLPLGVLSTERFNVDTYKFEMRPGDRFYMWSDGIIESRNEADDMFGESRLLELFQQNQSSEQLFGEIQSAVQQFIGDKEHDDDLTMVEIAMMPEHELGLEGSKVGKSALKGPTNWHFTYEMRNESLREFNALPLLMHVIMEVPGLRSFSGQVYTMLAELMSNALEHGVLGLDSKMKQTPAGFAAYYMARAEKLKEFNDGWIKIMVDHQPLEKGGVLAVRVEDSGEGFDYSDFNNRKLVRTGYSGRGIPLIGSLCRRLEYLGKGNIVEVEFVWRPE